MEERKFYKVITDLYHYKLPDPLEHGYASEREFRRALRRLSDYWRGRVGECVAKRHDHMQLRFHDTPGGKPDEAWLPVYLLQPAEPPEYLTEPDDEASDPLINDIDNAFGFD